MFDFLLMMINFLLTMMNFYLRWWIFCWWCSIFCWRWWIFLFKMSNFCWKMSFFLRKGSSINFNENMGKNRQLGQKDRTFDEKITKWLKKTWIWSHSQLAAVGAVGFLHFFAKNDRSEGGKGYPRTKRSPRERSVCFILYTRFVGRRPDPQKKTSIFRLYRQEKWGPSRTF